MKSLRMLLIAGFVLSIAGVVWTQEGATSRPNGIGGTLVKVDGKSLVVKVRQRNAEAKEVTVATDDKTTFVVDAEAGKLEDLKADMRVFITPAEGTATKVVATSKGLNGTVVKVDGKNVIVKVRQQGAEAKEVTVATDENTKVFVGEKAAKLEDLKADMRVTVLPETGTAKKILAMPARRAGGGGQ
jgi:ribosomal protein L21E